MSAEQGKRAIFHYWVHYASLCLLAIFMPTSRFMMSATLILLVLNWLAEGGYREKFRLFYSSRAALAFTGIYLTYLVALIWSKDPAYAFSHDLFHKAPTLIVPLILVSSPKIEMKKLTYLVLLFSASLFVVTLIGLTVRLTNPGSSFRDASPFMPGIYMGLMLAIAAYIMPLSVKQISDKKHHVWISLVFSLWFVFYLLFLRSLSAIFAFTIVGIYLLISLIQKRKSITLKLAFSILVLALLFAAGKPLYDTWKLSQLEIDSYSAEQEYSSLGNPWQQDTTRFIRENGCLVYRSISNKELEAEWNLRSSIDFRGKDLNGWAVSHTIYRYMASLGLSRDSLGLSRLSDKDIEAIEKGYTNHLYVHQPGFLNRIQDELMGVYIYRASGFTNPEWSSFSKRVDLWRASLSAFREKPVFGWGTGSILKATDHGFMLQNSPLAGNNMKPHSQYILLLLNQGITGFILFFLLLIYSIRTSGAWKMQGFRIFMILLALFCLANNPLESQIGQNLFVLISLYYILLVPKALASPAGGQGKSI